MRITKAWEGGGEAAYLCKLVGAFAACLCHKYQNFKNWLIYSPGPEVIKLFLCSTEHEIYLAHKC